MPRVKSGCNARINRKKMKKSEEYEEENAGKFELAEAREKVGDGT
jgi:hypothetical protein